MKVEQLMTRSVRTCRPSDRLSDAAQLMWDGDCGCLPVLGDDGSRRVVGMITDRDICMASHFRGRPLGEIPVAEAMATCVRSVGPSEDLADAEAIMGDAQVRRLPVVDGDQQLLGLLALADLAREADRKRRSKRPPVTEEEVGDTLTAICGPRSAPRVASA
jgi:CBS-domain-containing membrane protein